MAFRVEREWGVLGSIGVLLCMGISSGWAVNVKFGWQAHCPSAILALRLTADGFLMAWCSRGLHSIHAGDGLTPVMLACVSPRFSLSFTRSGTADCPPPSKRGATPSLSLHSSHCGVVAAPSKENVKHFDRVR
ncbi:unnamed protein product [Ostreobium quekettii]|uniref:Uncharacterized protein n=1 Tax=Ostreobium quekettii TaxID=121088 RepID=A0A8S1J8R6_9CHLO|nr:unnamed protein product [Ostreobium quekettii]